MRSRRFSFVAGWAAVALLAVAGFAAFGDPNPTTQEVQIEAAGASLGHTSGAYAGLAFALLGGQSDDGAATETAEDSANPDLVPTAITSEATAEVDSAGTVNSGTIASPASGWLSEVEVRALVSLYFRPEDVNQAVRIAWCESRFDPNSVNLRTGAIGLFQHLPKYWGERASSAGFPGYDPANPEASTAAAAWAVYEGGGWDVFACRG